MGNFELETSAYPIGYMRAGGDHKVFDMQNLKPLHSHAISKDDAVRIAADTNNKIRAKKLTLNDVSTDVAEYVELQVSKL